MTTESRRYNCFTRNGGNAIHKHAGPEAKGSNPITGLTLLWARNTFRGNFNHWQVSLKFLHNLYTISYMFRHFLCSVIKQSLYGLKLCTFLEQIYIMWAKFRNFNVKTDTVWISHFPCFSKLRCAYEVIDKSAGSLRLTTLSTCLPYVNCNRLPQMRVPSDTYTKFNLNDWI